MVQSNSHKNARCDSNVYFCRKSQVDQGLNIFPFQRISPLIPSNASLSLFLRKWDTFSFSFEPRVGIAIRDREEEVEEEERERKRERERERERERKGRGKRERERERERREERKRNFAAAVTCFPSREGAFPQLQG
jgi:hypothetical protein